MSEIKIFNLDMDLLYIEHYYDMISWEILLNDVGKLSATFNRNKNLINTCMNNDYLYIMQDNDYWKQAKITGLTNLQKNKTIYEPFQLVGFHSNFMLNIRTIPPFSSTALEAGKRTIDNILRAVIPIAFSDITNFEYGDDAGFTAQHDTFETTERMSADKFVSNLLALENAGYRFYADIERKKWVFQPIKSKTNKLLISKSNRNVVEESFVYNNAKYYTGGFYKENQLEGEPIEKYIGDNSKSGIYRWDTVFTDSSQSEANSSLLKLPWEKNVYIKTKGIQFNESYNLGDIVRVQQTVSSYQNETNRQIAGVNITYDKNGKYEEPIFKEV